MNDHSYDVRVEGRAGSTPCATAGRATRCWRPVVGNVRSAAPPVPTTNSRMPAALILVRVRVLRREPLVVVVVAVDRRGPRRRRRARPRTARPSASLPCSPELNRGWCQIASVQRAFDAARSAVSQRPCGESGAAAADDRAIGIEDDHVPRPEVVASTSSCRSARPPSRSSRRTRQGPCVSQSWLPAAGRVRSRKRPQVGP